MEKIWQKMHQLFLDRLASSPARTPSNDGNSSSALDWFLSKRHMLHDSLFPNRGLEAWKYTSLKELESLEPVLGSDLASGDDIRRTVKRLTRAESIGEFWSADGVSVIVTLDGTFRPDLSEINSNCLVVQEILSPRWNPDSQSQPSAQSPAKDWGSAISALHRSFTPVTVEITQSRESDTSVTPRVIWINLRYHAFDTNFGAARICIRISEDQKLDLLQIDGSATTTSPLSQGQTKLFLQEVDARIESGGFLRLIHLHESTKGECVLAQQQTRLSKDASFHFLSSSKGEGLLRNMTSAVLEQEGSHAELSSYYHPSANGHIDNQLLLHHQSGKNSSRQHYKGLISDKSSAVFHGTICISQGADGTEAHQLNRNVLLGPDAQVNAQPELRIDADDVVCSHGATVGPLSEEEIFYLQSRALSRSEALRLMREGFILELIDGRGWNRDIAVPFANWSKGDEAVSSIGQTL